jgi:hypothetical protein
MDGFVISVASVVAGAVTNPLGDGFYQSYRGARTTRWSIYMRRRVREGRVRRAAARGRGKLRRGRVGRDSCSRRCSSRTGASVSSTLL